MTVEQQRHKKCYATHKSTKLDYRMIYTVWLRQTQQNYLSVISVTYKCISTYYITISFIVYLHVHFRHKQI